MSKGRPPTEAEIQLLENEWAIKPERSRRKIHQAFEQRHGKNIIGLRKAQALISTFPRNSAEDVREPKGPVERFPYEEWKPWRKASSETNAFLLVMGAVCHAVQNRSMYDHEARWGMRLRIALEDLMPYDQFCFVSIYAQREVVNFHLNKPEVDTADLDAILAYRPWLPENAHAYGVLAWTSTVPKPLPGSRAELSFDDAVHNLITGNAWETLRVDLRPPWYMDPEELKQFPFTEFWVNRPELVEERDAYTADEWGRRGRNTALQFWMGDNPIFEKPQLHGKMLPLIEPVNPDQEVQQDSTTNKEANS